MFKGGAHDAVEVRLVDWRRRMLPADITGHTGGDAADQRCQQTDAAGHGRPARVPSTVRTERETITEEKRASESK